MTTVTVPGIPGLTDHELRDAWCAGAVGLPELAAECERRDRAQRRSAAARAASRRRHTEWESAAYAQYLEAEARTCGNLLSAAGRRAQRDPWPMLWQGSEETARRLASEELLAYWDYEAPRPPGPGAYAAAQRNATERSRTDVNGREQPSAMAAAEAAALAAAASPATVPPMAPGAIARYTAALSAFGAHVDDLAARMEARLERINEGNQR